MPTPADMVPDVYVLIGDCLRAASATERTLPFCRGTADVRFGRCYAPGTWTLPSHASLYAGSSAVDHGITRWGDRLDPGQAWLPEAARQHGYVTALFSENPTFSGRYGFDHGVDFADDFVNAKRFPSAVAPEAVVDGVSPGAALAVLSALLGSDRPVRNLANAAYAPLSYASHRIRTGQLPGIGGRFPHRGDRVLSHCREFVADRSDRDAPVLAFVNLLEPHNPHSVPPRAGARELDLDHSRSDQRRLAAVDDNKCYLFEHPDAPPSPAADAFPSWGDVFARREAVYEAQIREFDRLVERWASGLGADFDDALVVVTGDHGQLFGEEGMVGHHTSLHPHAVHVPLLASLPSSWTASTERSESAPGSESSARPVPRTVEAPVSLVGLSRAIHGVVTGEVDDGDAFVDRVRAGSGASVQREPFRDGSTGDATDEAAIVGPEAIASDEGVRESADPVVVAVDGPNWNVADLEDRYGPDAVADLAVRKVGLIGTDTQVVFASPWDDDSIAVSEYVLAGGDRRQVADCEYDAWLESSEVAERLREAVGEDRLDAFERWLAPERTAAEAGPASNRLRQLGYR